MADDALLEQLILAMPWKRFEQLVFALTRAEHTDAVPLKSPDGGADTLIPESSDLSPEARQAKHYTGAPHWKKCEKSLDDAVENHKAKRVTFVFPHNLTDPQLKAFQERLAERHPEVNVRAWGLDELLEQVHRYPDVRSRFFPETENLLEPLKRQISQGGHPLDTGKDLVERAKALGDFTESQDPDFAYRVDSGGLETPEPNWDDLPFMTVQVSGQKSKVRVDAWARKGADVQAPSVGFLDNEEGRAAFTLARRELAAGRETKLKAGVRILVAAPTLMRPFLDEVADQPGGEFTISPGEGLPLSIEFATDEGPLAWEVPIRPLPPRAGGHIAFGGYVGAALLELDFTLPGPPNVHLDLRVTAKMSDETEGRGETTEFLAAFFHHHNVTVSCPRLMENPITGAMTPNEDPELGDRLLLMRDFYRGLDLIEERLGRRFELPEAIRYEDLAVVGTVAEILKTRRGTGSFETGEAVVEAQEIAWIPERFAKEKTIRRPVTYEIFGEEVTLGVGEYELPPVKVVEIAPHGATPNAPARIKVAADGDPTMRFKLVS